MKATIQFLIIFVLCSFNATTSKEDEKEIKRFITEAADARRMDREEGRLASERGTTKEIRDYGKLMVKEQTLLLGKLQKLASAKKIMLPKEISEKKAKVLEKLKELNGTDFDKKFLKTIKIDHKRDVKEFKNATEYTDIKTQSFALKYLMMIQKHLDGVEKIMENK